MRSNVVRIEEVNLDIETLLQREKDKHKEFSLVFDELLNELASSQIANIQTASQTNQMNSQM